MTSIKWEKITEETKVTETVYGTNENTIACYIIGSPYVTIVHPPEIPFVVIGHRHGFVSKADVQVGEKLCLE